MSWGSLGRPGALGSWAHLGPSWRRLEDVLGRLGGSLGGLGGSWAALGRLFGGLGRLLGPLGSAWAVLYENNALSSAGGVVSMLILVPKWKPR